ncbi:murein transglycosylase [Cladophialophora yegresii CBS 114405]|uniref:glucan endo-1,3-beta-D-glucosidase n=1 Tax=Cladophialophora yegresii CBS 114405 TaxID=1182544 RepID=W9W2T6_9EURO|nr:murein transglycosylase [Cladophialophora yegresii CBS 114405]EXJ62288.1 murein transglycosylase [Cladophialophora yegresii CBS 114405]
MSTGGRSFSFEPQNDSGLNPDARQAQAQGRPPQSYTPSYQQPYQEPLDRDFTSPPPRYASASPNRSQQLSPPSSPRRRPVSSDTHLLSDLSPPKALARQTVPTSADDFGPPPPPPHRTSPDRLPRAEHQSYRPYAEAIAGMDNYGDRAAYPQSYTPYQQQAPSRLPERSSYGSTFALAQGAATPGRASPSPSGHRSSAYSGRGIPLDDYHSNSSRAPSYPSYHDLPYQSSNPAGLMNQASINPNNILDDADDDGFPARDQQRDSGRRSAAPGAAAGAAGFLGGLFGRKAKNHTPSGTYNAVDGRPQPEKSQWLSEQTNRKRKMKLWVGIAIGLVIVVAIVAGIVGGVLGNKNSDDSGSFSGDTSNAASDTAANGDLDKNSAEIKALMNNKNLHKVFPGMDYTPWGTQYPLCHTYPPSQNNVTRDMAVLSQLTNVVRLYGTDCNQTEMVLHAIDRLELTDMKVWMGVWIDTNQTTIDRQLDQMYKILAETKDLSIFKGVIVGNEALYRAGEDKAQSEQELITYLGDVRSKFKSLGYDLPIATSDLGDNWNAQLTQAVDYVMSNIHPFFAGVTAEVAASWTWDFWQNHDVILTQGMPDVKQLISETGWPSGGGKDCGGTDGSCQPGQSGSVAGVDEMNTFMDNWVCQALQNGTDYFWFEAFDEPWKVVYNTATQAWEDKWGLMDPARNLKPGLKIPDCGGKTVGS